MKTEEVFTLQISRKKLGCNDEGFSAGNFSRQLLLLHNKNLIFIHSLILLIFTYFYWSKNMNIHWLDEYFWVLASSTHQLSVVILTPAEKTQALHQTDQWVSPLWPTIFPPISTLSTASFHLGSGKMDDHVGAFTDGFGTLGTQDYLWPRTNGCRGRHLEWRRHRRIDFAWAKWGEYGVTYSSGLGLGKDNSHHSEYLKTEVNFLMKFYWTLDFRLWISWVKRLMTGSHAAQTACL